MLRASKRIIISTEAVNEYGFRVLTDGIDLSQYEKNPVMLYMHIRAYENRKDQILPLGNMIELAVEEVEGVGKVLTGLPLFDDTDDFAVKIYNKYENGTLRMASAGLKPLDWSDDAELALPGQTGWTLVKSKLRESSICDLGVQDGALSLALYDENDALITLSDKGDNAAIPQLKISNTDMKLIQLSAPDLLGILKLSEGATDAQVLEKIKGIITLSETQIGTINTLTTEKEELQKQLNETKELQLSEKIENLVQKAVDDRKILADEKPDLIALAQKDFSAVESLLSKKTASQSVQQQLGNGGNNTTSEVNELVKLSYDELDRGGKLVTLKTLDLAAFQTKYKEKFKKEYNG